MVPEEIINMFKVCIRLILFYYFVNNHYILYIIICKTNNHQYLCKTNVKTL